jgi:hypothetical protein
LEKKNIIDMPENASVRRRSEKEHKLFEKKKKLMLDMI